VTLVGENEKTISAAEFAKPGGLADTIRSTMEHVELFGEDYYSTEQL